MPDHRKPPVQSAGRGESRPMPDEPSFSIETTTMRLKSLKVRRAEAANQALEDQLQANSGTKAAPAPLASGPAGRVRHDERGMAVWDWAAAAGDTAALSATNLMRKLDVSGLSIEQTHKSLKAMEQTPARDSSAGADPYNQHRPPPADPFKRNSASGSDPYNRGNLNTVQAHRPAPKTPVPARSTSKPANSVLDQLTGKKK